MNTVLKNCLNCGNEFSVKKSIENRVHNCSKKCGYETKKSRYLVHTQCGTCQKDFSFRRSSRKKQDIYYCSISCSAKKSGKKKTGEWKFSSDGYVYKNINGKKTFQHRVLMEEFLGRKLMDKENVHHINGNKSDNRIENLELWSHHQPKGQRVGDKLSAAIQLLKDHGYMIIDPMEGLVVGVLHGAEMPRVN